MKSYKCSLVLLISAFILSTALAQTASAQTGIDRDTTHFNDEDIYNEGNSAFAPSYNWLGGGFVGGILLADLSSFNAKVAQPFIHQNLSQTIPMLGGHFFIPFPFIKNIRVGGVGAGGKSQICCVNDTVSAGQPVQRTLRYSVGYGGVTVDYSLPIRISKCHILVGTELGFGSIDIYAKQAASRTAFDISSEFNAPTTNITHTYTSNIIVIKPQVTFEWAPLSFMMFRASAAYQVTSGSTWKADEDVPLGNTDNLKSVGASGFVANAGVYIGLFQ